jgi:co-chaperonin GroES (HSP10)
MIKRGTLNSVLVEIEKLSDSEYTFASGAKLFMDTSYKPEQHQRIYGECVAVPEILTKGDQIKYEDGDFRFADSIEPEVRVGDRVYFVYLTINKQNLIEHEGKTYCNIPYSAILCVVRKEPLRIEAKETTTHLWENGKGGQVSIHKVEGKLLSESIEIIPIGGNIICEEYYGKGATYTEVEGKKIYGEVSKSGLVTGIIKKPSQKHAVIKIVGTPLKGDVMEVSPGDIVAFPDKFAFKNNIEGADYLFIKYWDINAIVGNESESLV